MPNDIYIYKHACVYCELVCVQQSFVTTATVIFMANYIIYSKYVCWCGGDSFAVAAAAVAAAAAASEFGWLQPVN